MDEKTFLELLKKFNGGIVRGSQRSLAQKLNIDESSIANFRKGRQTPSEKLLKKMAQVLKTKESELQKIFEINNSGYVSTGDININYNEKLKIKNKEIELLKQENNLLKEKIKFLEQTKTKR